jgi:hypothetical protein
MRFIDVISTIRNPHRRNVRTAQDRPIQCLCRDIPGKWYPCQSLRIRQVHRALQDRRARPGGAELVEQRIEKQPVTPALAADLLARLRDVAVADLAFSDCGGQRSA